MLPLYVKIMNVFSDAPAKPECARNPNSQSHRALRAKHFTRTALVLVRNLVGIITVLCMTAIAYGYNQPLSNLNASLGLEWCGGAPCFKGVTPGLMPWTEAQKIFAGVDRSQVFAKQIIALIGADGEVHLFHSENGNRVGRILLVIPSAMFLSVGDLVARFGPPCGISIEIYPVDNVVILFYPMLVVRTQIFRKRLAIDMPVKIITFRDPAIASEPGKNTCQEESGALSPQFINRAWHGFASMDTYLTQDH